MCRITLTTVARVHRVAAAAALVMAAGTGALAAEPCVAPTGGNAGEIFVDGAKAQRVESYGEGTGLQATWGHDRWLVFRQPSCRVVGLTIWGSRGSAYASAFFLTPRGQKPLTAKEREALLQWAGQTLADSKDPRDALHAAPWLPTGRGVPEPDVPTGDGQGTNAREAPHTAVHCDPSDVVRLPRSEVPFAMPRNSWKREDWGIERVEQEQQQVPEGFRITCPCFSVFFGEMFRQKGDGPSTHGAGSEAQMALPGGRRLVDLVSNSGTQPTLMAS
jgi:hypothetical protein